MGLWTGASYVDPDEMYKKKNKHKVFCEHCRHLIEKFCTTRGTMYECMHKNNVDPSGDTWRQPSRKGKRHPSALNENNDCGWYKNRRRPTKC